MIDPKELMIGCKVIHKGKEATCATISDTVIVIKYDDGLPDMAQISDIDPIPLTPEILERYGL